MTHALVCPTETVVNITLLSSSQQESFTFTPVVLSNSYEIFGLSAELESIGDTAGDLWSCSIFLIGPNNETVAITRPVRSAINNIMCITLIFS